LNKFEQGSGRRFLKRRQPLQRNRLPPLPFIFGLAISLRIMGVKNFQTLSTKAAVLFRLNRGEEAKKLMAEVLPTAAMDEVHGYARMLLRAGETQEAVKVYKANYEKYPNQFVTNVGMGRVYSAQGDYKKAIEYLKTALPQAPDNYNKNLAEGMIKKLEEGKNVN
jgi:tetratricopeptide (TPR) repeat protein